MAGQTDKGMWIGQISRGRLTERGRIWWTSYHGGAGRVPGGMSSRDDILGEIVEQVETSEEVQEEIIEYEDDILAEAVDYAKSISPVWPSQESQGREPGTFRDSIYGERAEPIDGMPTALLISSDDRAGYIEYGTRKTPEHGVFAKTAAHFNDLETHE